MQYEVAGVDMLLLSIVVLFAGQRLTRGIPFLERNNIPPAVTGGLIFSGITALLMSFDLVTLSFDMSLRDLLLLTFFSTIGLGAKFRMLAAGGKSLVLLLACAAVFLVVQDATGVGIAYLFGAHPAAGLFAGSISFAGGHGTAIAWGNEAAAAGFTRAKDIGIAFATFGLIMGGVIGGPIGGRLVERFGLGRDTGEGQGQEDATTTSALGQPDAESVGTFDILGTLFSLGLCIAIGDWINRFLFSSGVMLPGFLTAMLVGIIITNLSDVFQIKISKRAVDTTGDVALQLFLSMSLLSMQLTSLAQGAAPIIIALFIQMLVITIFAVFIVFRVMGRNYDAAVITAGFVGLGLGATPVAIANMSAMTARYRPSPKAFLVVPLVGAFFIDLANAVVIKIFLALPLFQRAASDLVTP